MIRPTTSLALGTFVMASLLSPMVFADQPKQSRMQSCNVEGKYRSLSGYQRKTFLRQCLTKKVPKGEVTQREKLRSCNKQARSFRGDRKKRFRRGCLAATP